MTEFDEIEEYSKEFIENQPILEELSRKVSREGLRRAFLIVSTYPFVGDLVNSVKSDTERELVAKALRMSELRDKVKADFDEKSAQEEVVDNIVSQVTEGVKNGG